MLLTAQQTLENQTDLNSDSLSPLGTEQLRDESTKGLNLIETKCIHAYMNNPHIFLYRTAFNFAEIKAWTKQRFIEKHRKENLAHSSYSDKQQRKKRDK